MSDTLIPIDMAGRTSIRAWLAFDERGSFTREVHVQSGDRKATWLMFIRGHEPVRFMSGDRTLKPKNCGGVPNYIRHYARTHVPHFEQLLKP